MKFSCTRDNLYRGLSVTGHLGGKNVDLPILSNVHLKVADGSLKLTATNLEIASTCLVRGKIDQEGECTVPAKLFFDYVSLLPSEQVDLELEGTTLKIRCGGHSTKLNGISASEFPLVPLVSGGRVFSFSAEEFRAAVGGVLFAVATNEARPELSGVSIRFHEEAVGPGKAVLAATDSYRLAEQVIAVSGSTEAASVIVPARTLSEISRILSLAKDDVEVPEAMELTVTDNQILARYGSVELMSRLIDGRYPDYRQIIPTSFKTEAIFETQALVKAIKTASLFSRTGLFDVHLLLSSDKKSITVKGADTARGENITECPAEITGGENEVKVNYRYVLDGLQALDGDEAVLQMIDAGNPCVITPKTKDDKSAYQYVVMPIKQ